MPNDATPKGVTPKQFATFSAKRVLSDLVYNMSYAEGNSITLEEVMTLMDGISVGGRQMSDVNQIMRLESAWNELLRLVENDQFELSKRTAIHLNELVATDEALKVGSFRDGRVGIRGADYTPPHYSELDRNFENMVEEVNGRDTTLERAVSCFTLGSRNQFFYDGNKRTSQLLMNGVLLSGGEHVITIPAKDRDMYF